MAVRDVLRVGFSPHRLPLGDRWHCSAGKARVDLLAQRFSDHAPLIIDYDFDL
ncbi:MAG: hypothetical protein H7Z19_01950 [Chitinophagaceae bacterium]|nr:hypothetical protein [Rubrivivax sp.]